MQFENSLDIHLDNFWKTAYQKKAIKDLFFYKKASSF